MTGAEAVSQPDWSPRLHGLAKPFLFPGRLPDVDGAIRLACDLLVNDLDSPATIRVAALPFGSSARDWEPLIRAMFLEQGVLTPDREASDDERFRFMLQWFAAGYLTLGDIWQSLLSWLPAWEDQAPFQRVLARLSNELDQNALPAVRAEIIAAMRAIAACPVDATNAELPLRISVESAFRVTGRGTVLAGTIEQGTIRAGDEIELVLLTDHGVMDTVPLICKSMGSIFQPGRDPALSPVIAVLVDGIEPESVKAGGWLQHQPHAD